MRSCASAQNRKQIIADTDTAAKNIRIKDLHRRESNKRLFTAGLFLWETVVFANQYPGIVSVTLYEQHNFNLNVTLTSGCLFYTTRI